MLNPWILREVEFIQFVYIVSETSQTEYARRLQNATKQILKMAVVKFTFPQLSRTDVSISRCFVNFCKQQQRNKEEIITHAYTAFAVEVCLIKLPKTE